MYIGTYGRRGIEEFSTPRPERLDWYWVSSRRTCLLRRAECGTRYQSCPPMIVFLFVGFRVCVLFCNIKFFRVLIFFCNLKKNSKFDIKTFSLVVHPDIKISYMTSSTPTSFFYYFFKKRPANPFPSSQHVPSPRHSSSLRGTLTSPHIAPFSALVKQSIATYLYIIKRQT